MVRNLVRVFLFAGTMLACLGVVEVCLRLKNSSMTNYDIEMWRYARLLKVRSDNPLLGHEHRPNCQALLQSVTIRTNELGLRGGPLAPRQSEERRILFLGSSVTLGWGVAEEETVTGRVQEHFNQDHKNVTVLNGGIGNYNAARYVERFLTRLTSVDPTDIVVHGFVRDAEVLEAGGGNWLLQNSQLAVMTWTILQQRLATRRGSLEDHYRKVYDPQGPGWQAMDQAIGRLAEYARTKGIRLYFAMTPDVHNLENYPLHFVHEQVRELAVRHGYQYLDLFPAFAGLKPEEVWAMPGDPHPNSYGHQRMADLIYPFLQRELVSKK